MKKLPKVVIVGRMNVGKSTLFNRLSENVKTITMDYSGVTRDIIKDVISWQDRTFELIDTGGISFRKSHDPLMEQVRLKALEAIKTANVVLFVCDAKIGILPEDREISRMLFSLSSNVLLVVNKVDNALAEEQLYEFEKLGYEKIFYISAQHGTAIAELLEEIIDQLPDKKSLEEETEKEPICKVVLLGKPNVGKSSLLNILVQQERAIVFDLPGTTREPVSETISYFKEDIVLTDTAGVRRKRSVDEPLENMMVKSSFKALKDADLVLLLIDASEGRISDQELKLAFYAFEEQKKALIILFNKQDLVDEQMAAEMKYSLEPYNHLIKRVECMNISCKSEKNIGKLLAKIHKVSLRHTQTFSNDDLSFFFKEALIRKPLYKNTNSLRVLRVRQIESKPITLLLIVNDPRSFGDSQLTYFENLMRREYDLGGVPIKFIVRKKG